jgi:hypothetical protein
VNPLDGVDRDRDDRADQRLVSGVVDAEHHRIAGVEDVERAVVRTEQLEAVQVHLPRSPAGLGGVGLLAPPRVDLRQVVVDHVGSGPQHP